MTFEVIILFTLYIIINILWSEISLIAVLSLESQKAFTNGQLPLLCTLNPKKIFVMQHWIYAGVIDLNNRVTIKPPLR